jgi:hypothetical protein
MWNFSAKGLNCKISLPKSYLKSSPPPPRSHGPIASQGGCIFQWRLYLQRIWSMSTSMERACWIYRSTSTTTPPHRRPWDQPPHASGPQGPMRSRCSIQSGCAQGRGWSDDVRHYEPDRRQDQWRQSRYRGDLGLACRRPVCAFARPRCHPHRTFNQSPHGSPGASCFPGMWGNVCCLLLFRLFLRSFW